MKINYCCLYYCSNVVLFLSSVTKTSEDKRMVTDHCCLRALTVLNMDENDVDYDEWKKIFLLNLLYDYVVNVQQVHQLTKILHDKNTNGNCTVDCSSKQREYVERFHIEDNQGLYKAM